MRRRASRRVQTKSADTRQSKAKSRSTDKKQREAGLSSVQSLTPLFIGFNLRMKSRCPGNNSVLGRSELAARPTTPLCECCFGMFGAAVYCLCQFVGEARADATRRVSYSMGGTQWVDFLSEHTRSYSLIRSSRSHSLFLSSRRRDMRNLRRCRSSKKELHRSIGGSYSSSTRKPFQAAKRI